MEKHLERHLLRRAFKEFLEKTLGDHVEESMGIAFRDLCPGLRGRVIGEARRDICLERFQGASEKDFRQLCGRVLGL